LAAAPLRIERAGDAVAGGEVDAAHAGLGGEGDEGRVLAGQVALAAQVELLLGEDDDAAALGGLVGQGGELGGVGQPLRETPGRGRTPPAMRLPRVMVPVLSSSRTSMSPAASTARPLMARTLRCRRRSMPAMPIALRRPPMVVGIRQTRSAISAVIEKDVE
jgi:hypothetical protein